MKERAWWALLGIGCFVVGIQVAVANTLSLGSVSPNLCLLVTVAVSLSRGLKAGVLTGIGLGLGLDLMPPVEHTVGLWALALGACGVLVSVVMPGGAPALVSSIGVTGLASLVATSLFAWGAMARGDLQSTVPDVLRVVLGNAAYDVALAAVLIWPLLIAIERWWPEFGDSPSLRPAT